MNQRSTTVPKVAGIRLHHLQDSTLVFGALPRNLPMAHAEKLSKTNPRGESLQGSTDMQYAVTCSSIAGISRRS